MAMANDPGCAGVTSGSAGDAGPPRFCCVNDAVPPETIDLLRQACAARGVAFLEIDAASFDFDPDRQLVAGELLYRPAVSYAAGRVEQFLYSPGVATFYRDADGIFFDPTSAPLLFEHAGLSVPRTLCCWTTDRALLKRFVEHVGGLPVIVKLLGGEGGVGVMRVESLAALFSVMDFAQALGRSPLLCAYVDDAVHWRVVVVGDRAVAAYRNTREADDFRTFAGDDPRDVTAEPEPALADVAVRAVAALHAEFGGVDILRHPSGRLYVLEANFPCYFPHAQRVGGIDVAGRMLDFLLTKSRRLTAG
jgi:hypothetical protein